MTDSWDEVLDWERWAREVLTDWRVPFDNHRVGLRLGITQQLCDLRDERDALSARLAGTQDLYVQACEQRDDALALLTKVSLRKSCEGTQPYICHGLATARARLAEAERDAARYRYMRGNASFRDRNGPGLYWYLPRFLPGGSAEQLDASIDASITADSADDAPEKCLDCGKTIDLCGCAL